MVNGTRPRGSSEPGFVPREGTSRGAPRLAPLAAGLRAAIVVSALALGVAAGLHACSSAEPPAGTCDPAACALDCWTARWSGGECRDDECRCFSWGADADADADDVRPESPDRGPEDIRDVDVDAPDRREADVRPEVICELPPDWPETRDDLPAVEECCGPETHEAKSGCDPLLCFLSCGGTCSVAGECECAPSS
ncbi:MAG: hypothetical protein HY825_12235 [Acidobacteria bacterium]|nr:hypothetical protein [Acidobacteriota bacterium]